jgi:crotonobetainyl-CoA:carnitine CoA-transferase CaiB-like acyl-CoA transferase
MNLSEKSFASGAFGLLNAVRVVAMSRLVSGHMVRPQLANLGAEVINGGRAFGGSRPLAPAGAGSG